LQLRSSIWPRIRSSGIAVAVLAALVAGCGGDSQSEAPVTLGVIQNLVVDAVDGVLVIASPNGMYRFGKNDKSATRLGSVGWNVRGLVATGPHELLASGNSTPQDPQPRKLGLQRSDDGGKTWRGEALVGKHAFDTIHVSGDWIYGLERARGLILVSSDRGRTWRTMRRPSAIVDLAVDPDNPQRLVLSEPLDSYFSRDGGRHWIELGAGSLLFAWPDSKNLYGVTSEGEVWRSPNGGERWIVAGDLALIPIVFAAGGPRDLYAALADGTILHSPVGGDGWDVLLTAAT
jgi:hypothetical protein